MLAWRRAHPTCSARTVPRGVDPCNGMWRDRVSPASSGAQTRRVKTAVVGWATAESPAAGSGAVHDRCTDESQVPSIVMTASRRVQLGARRGRSG